MDGNITIDNASANTAGNNAIVNAGANTAGNNAIVNAGANTAGNNAIVNAGANTAGNSAIDTLGKTVDNENNQAMEAPNDKSAEDTTPDGYRAMLEEKDELIATLMQQNAQYHDQIVNLIRNGAQIQDGNGNGAQTATENADPTSAEDYISLADLGNEIGKS